MIKIGDFANLCNTTIKTVRYYESIGLLIPCYVDIYTGYRYYDEKNLERMYEILTLKDLGFSLEEIKYFNDDTIKDKIQNYEIEIKQMKEKIKELGVVLMSGKIDTKEKKFINDENAIGHWQMLGISSDMEDAEKRIFMEDDYHIKDLYLMPNGENYWVISWTKGYVYILDAKFPYVINGNTMYLTINDKLDKLDSKVIVYQKIDSLVHHKEDFRYRDDTNIPLTPNEDAVGIWEAVDYINNENSFNPNKIQTPKLYLLELIFKPNNELYIKYRDNDKIQTSKYTKDYLIDLCFEDTLSKYKIETINNQEYLIVEWKSGDYIYGKLIYGYYVFKKVS